MMIRISATYSDALSPLELYEMTRGFWRVDVEHARQADYVLAVYQGIVREVYQVADWFPVGRRSCSEKKMEHGPRTATNSSVGLPTRPSSRNTA